MTVKSKFKFGYVYFTGTIFSLFLLLGSYLALHPRIMLQMRRGGFVSAGYIGWFIILFSLVLFYVLLKEISTVEITADELNWNGPFASMSIIAPQIRSIRLFSRARSGNRSVGGPEQGILIELIDGGTVSIPDRLYRNMPQLRHALRQNFPLLTEGDGGGAAAGTSPEPRKEKAAGTDGRSIRTFAGNPLLSMNGLFTLGFALAIGCLPFRSHFRPNLTSYIAIVLPILLFCWGFGTQMYYFQLSDDRLIIRNHFFPWYRRYFALSDIREVVFETPYKRSRGLRVTTADLHSRMYAAGSLWDKHWDALKAALKEEGLPMQEA
jgi:hypothetical protein